MQSSLSLSHSCKRQFAVCSVVCTRMCELRSFKATRVGKVSRKKCRSYFTKQKPTFTDCVQTVARRALLPDCLTARRPSSSSSSSDGKVNFFSAFQRQHTKRTNRRTICTPCWNASISASIRIIHACRFDYDRWRSINDKRYTRYK